MIEKKISMVSVVLPTYNRADRIGRTIQSILNQTYKYLEVIVVSDGSTDKTKEVVLGIKDPRILFIEQENSGGAACPRNTGIRAAKGEYIAFCDDDDVWMPEKLEKQIRALEENPDCELCYTDMLRFDETGKEWTLENDNGPCDLNSLMYVNTVPISSVFFRRKLIDEVGVFNESKSIGSSEDYEFLLRCAAKTKFYYINEYLLKYWSGDQRMTKLDSRQSFKTHYKYLCYILNSYKMLYSFGGVSITSFVLPIFFQAKCFFKSIIYIYFLRGFKKCFQS